MWILINKIINREKKRADLNGWRKKLKAKSNEKELIKVAKKIGATNVRF